MNLNVFSLKEKVRLFTKNVNLACVYISFFIFEGTTNNNKLYILCIVDCPSTSLIQPTSSLTCPKQTISETVSVRTVTIFQTTVQVVPTTRLSVSTVVTVSTSVSVSVSISVSTSIRTTTTTSVSTSTIMSTTTVTETKCSGEIYLPHCICLNFFNTIEHSIELWLDL